MPFCKKAANESEDDQEQVVVYGPAPRPPSPLSTAGTCDDEAAVVYGPMPAPPLNAPLPSLSPADAGEDEHKVECGPMPVRPLPQSLAQPLLDSFAEARAIGHEVKDERSALRWPSLQRRPSRLGEVGVGAVIERRSPFDEPVDDIRRRANVAPIDVRCRKSTTVPRNSFASCASSEIGHKFGGAQSTTTSPQRSNVSDAFEASVSEQWFARLQIVSPVEFFPVEPRQPGEGGYYRLPL
eukprot:CAMPEP_0117511356 /NCGR_PEP_ID=MMETSP0784-20121206/28466_1 /TAXON_ID=39447 /ORGANISM="" /LENGTH=238 /DNA_ID=CAMNT_0005307027 /DNA_START=84 /DNA_END=800 /DNA_ORIENTATION=+